MPIDPKVFENLKPGEYLPVQDVPGWGTAGFNEETFQDIIRNSIKQVSVSPVDILKHYVYAQDYTHPFMLSLFAIYIIVLFVILKCRRKAMIQMVIFFASFLIIQSTETINGFLYSSVGQTMYKSNPFDDDLLFTNIYIAFPAAVFIMFILGNMVFQSIVGYCGRRGGHSHKHGPNCNHDKNNQQGKDSKKRR